MLAPVPDTDRLRPLIHAVELAAGDEMLGGRKAARLTSDQRALFAAAPRESRQWNRSGDGRFGSRPERPRDSRRRVAGNRVGRLNGRDLFLHLARTLHASHRAPALFLFGWKTGAKATAPLPGWPSSGRCRRSHLLRRRAAQGSARRGVDPRRMPALRIDRSGAGHVPIGAPCAPIGSSWVPSRLPRYRRHRSADRPNRTPELRAVPSPERAARQGLRD
jgi:hypothetical protein